MTRDYVDKEKEQEAQLREKLLEKRRRRSNDRGDRRQGAHRKSEHEPPRRDSLPLRSSNTREQQTPTQKSAVNEQQEERNDQRNGHGEQHRHHELRRDERHPRDYDHDPSRRGPDAHRQRPPPLRPGIVARGQVSRMESYGAFVDLENGGRGLIHISQLVSDRRVEQVSDVLRLGQSVFAHVLDLENNRIRLSLIGIDQQTGEMDPRAAMEASQPPGNRSHWGNGGPARAMEQRARDRQRWLHESARAGTWRDAGKKDQGPPFWRDLWSNSPEPPVSKQSEKRKRSVSVHSSSGSSDDSRSEDNSSSSSEDSRPRKRRQTSRRRSRTSHRKSSSRRSGGRSSRRRSPSTSSSSSSSSSSDSYTSSSSSSEESRSVRSASDNSRERRSTSVGSRKQESEVALPENDLREAQDFKQAVQKSGNASDSDDSSVGPQPLSRSNAATNTNQSSSYGKALLPGEGQALAQYVQQNLRIPRRGEIGYTGDEIEKHETSGYVMSGSRHARMNAVRIRKENQVYSAEEQRALALITMEENQQKEAALMQDFRQMLEEKKRARESKGKP